MPVILVGGTPGTGKSEAARMLGERLGVRVLSLGDLARNAGCISAYDGDRDTSIVDEDCLVSAILQEIEDLDRRIVAEGHYIDLVPYSSVARVFVLRTHPEVLKHRLIQRGWPKAKIEENVEAEVIGVCQLDAYEAYGEDMVTEIDTTEIKQSEVVDMMQRAIRGNAKTSAIDWMTLLEEEGRLGEFLSDGTKS
ncbi:MAG: adenylate kinase family protein [Candidatus Thorarchaeota archaeon]